MEHSGKPAGSVLYLCPTQDTITKDHAVSIWLLRSYGLADARNIKFHNATTLSGESPLGLYRYRSLRDGLKREVTCHELISSYVLHLRLHAGADFLSKWAASAEPAAARRGNWRGKVAL